MSKETFYFSHDYNVRTDDKIKKLIRKHGIEGYGVYWCIVEDLYNNANALQLDSEGIAFDLRVDESIIKSILNDFELFTIKGNMFYSSSVNKRLDERAKKSSKARDSANARWEKQKSIDANALQTQSDSNAIKESKGKENKVNSTTIDFVKLIDFFNNLFGRQIRTIPSKAKKQIKDRLKDGYTKQDFLNALQNAHKDTYHIESNYKYITLEFISRPDKFERYSQNHNFKTIKKMI
jgi:uncharacterized phage protein (TIGR02220 family)